MTELIKYDAACKALTEAKSVDEVKHIRDIAEAMRAYARQAKNKVLELDAAEIRIRAERRVGEMIAAQKATVGLAKPPGKKREIGSEPDPIPALADAGIDKHLADRARKLARLPEVEFNARLGNLRERVEADNERVTIDLLRTAAHVSHASGENEWYTPVYLIEAARKTMGGIDCDPASSAVANKIVKAKRFYTTEDDGRSQDKWGERVWMNPPYAQPLVDDFATSLVERVTRGEVTQACVLVNNATETAWFQRMLGVASAVCFLSGRVRFIDADGEPSGAPLQGQAVVYVGPKPTTFGVAFGAHGVTLYRKL